MTTKEERDWVANRNALIITIAKCIMEKGPLTVQTVGTIMAENAPYNEYVKKGEWSDLWPVEFVRNLDFFHIHNGIVDMSPTFHQIVRIHKSNSRT